MPSLPRPANRLIRTAGVLILLSLLVVPPVFYPSLRPLYAPVFDHVVLPAQGHVWTRFYPFSMTLLVPLFLILILIWVEWICDRDLIRAIQRRVLTAALRLQPDLSIYRGLKKLQFFVVRSVRALRPSLRTRFPFNRIPERYHPGMVSGYAETLIEQTADRWAAEYRGLPTDHHAAVYGHRTAALLRGLAGLYVPDIRYAEALDPVCCVRAIDFLDNATLFDSEPDDTVERLFRHYLSNAAGRDPDFLTLSAIRRLLDDATLDHGVLLRVFIRLWFETRRPEVAAIPLDYMSRYLEEAQRRFDDVLDTRRDPTFREAPEPLPAFDLRRFASRYLDLVEQTRGPDAALRARQTLYELSRQAGEIERLMRRTPPDKKTWREREYMERIHALVSAFKQAMPESERYRHGYLLRKQAQTLQTFRAPVTDAMWMAFFQTRDARVFDRLMRQPAGSFPLDSDDEERVS